VRIAKGIEQAMKMGNIEGYIMGARTMMRVESEDDPEGGIIQTRYVNIMAGSWAIHLNSGKIFKNWDRMMVSKKQVEFVKDDVINHIVTKTSLDWQKIKNVWPSTNIARKADPKMVMNCQSFCCGFLPFCILFWGHISSLNKTYLSFVFLLFWNQEMLLSKSILTKYFDRTPTRDLG